MKTYKSGANQMEQLIMIVEDDITLAAGLTRALKSSGRTIKSCGRIAEARRLIQQKKPDLIILDVNLPDGSGFDFLTELRTKDNFPIILLTANDMEADIVAGLEGGADDYITKPFSLAVLRARVHAQLRRKEENEKSKDQGFVWKSGRYRFHFDQMEYYVDDKLVELSKNEQKLLHILIENEGITMRRENLIDRIWTNGAEYVDENALSVTIKRLRDKLQASQMIRTVYGIGYLWVKEDE